MTTANAHRVQLATTMRAGLTPVQVLLRWDTDAPDVVRLRVFADDVLDHAIPRGLLVEGVERPAEQDGCAWLAPLGPWVRIGLADSPLRLLAERDDLAGFLARVGDHLALERGVEVPADLGGLMTLWEGAR